MNGTPLVSVVIPTHNRAAELEATVATFLSQSYPRDRLEIIIVDNASTDDTPAVIAALEAESELVRGLHEQRRGAHFARNTGAMAARGDILYFTDDDMLADEQLLAEIVRGFIAGDRVGSVTGRVLPEWEAEPPEWVLRHCMNALLSLNDQGESLLVSDADPGVFSCHQAVLREAFVAAGGYNPDTNAGEFVGDNETGLNIKLRRLGYRFAYVGSALTRHRIPAARMTQKYLDSRFADQGFCDSYTSYRDVRPGRARLLRRIVGHSLLSVATLMIAGARRLRGDSRWRLDLARRMYFRNRVRYDLRLLLHARWREFALRDNWLGGESW